VKCIFCKKDSSDSKSVEHIVPESLGNKDIILKPGIVCDKCNNSLARNVEKPFLDHPCVRLLRSEKSLKSKKGNYPQIQAYSNGGGGGVTVRLVKDDNCELSGIEWDGISDELAGNIKKGEITSIIYPKFEIGLLPKGRVVSRLLGKMGLEELARRLSDYQEGLDEIAEKVALDPIRFHVRYGNPVEWPYSVREIDDIDQGYVNERGESFEILHEIDLLTLICEDGGMILYVIFLLHGMEFALCLNNPKIEGYYKWLIENNNESPLRTGKNKQEHDPLKKR